MASTGFIVVGVQRTGTTLIRTTLDNHSRVTCAGEVFKTARRGRKPYLGAHSYTTWMQTQSLGWLRDRLGREAQTHAFLGDLYGDDSAEVIGFKLMADQRGRYPAVVPWVVEHGIRAVHVVRRNTLKTYVSTLTARARGFHATGKVEQVTISVPTGDLLRRLEAIREGSDSWRSAFPDNHPRIEVAYEDFVAQRDRVLPELFGFLGVAPEAAESHLKKLNSDRLADVIVNYDEVAATLRGTPFEDNLDA